MSHRLTVEFGDYELGTLKEALTAMGWEVKENCICRGVAGGRLPLVAVNPSGSYDISIRVDVNGHVSFQHEAYLSLNETALGAKMSLLKQEYQIQSVKQYAQVKRGSILKRKVLKNAVVELELEINI